MTATLDDPPSVAAHLAERLDEASIPYAIGGALALAAYGEPRMTGDVDLSVGVTEANLDRLFDALERGGCLFDRVRAQAEVERFSLFRVRCGAVGVDLFVSFHPHHHEALARRVRLADPEGHVLWFLSVEDYAVHKLALFRPKDRMDLELLCAARGASMDWGYVEGWIRRIAPHEPDARHAELAALKQRFGG